MGMDVADWSVRERRGSRQSAPSPEELNPVVHAVGTRAGAEAQDTAQLLTHRVALLWSQNHPGVFAAGIDPFRMEPIEIGDVEAFGGVGQMLVVGLCHQAGIRSRGHCHVARAKSRNEAALYSVLVDIDLEELHRGSAPVLLCERVVLALFGFQIGVDLGLVGVMVGQSGMHLCQRQVAEVVCDLLRGVAHVMPHCDPTHGNARPGDARSTTANLRPPGDEAADFGHGCHRFQV